MGLNYLQKKNWHPGSIKNQEIVWIREQIQADFIKREQERAKKLLEEKNIEDLKKMQVDAGLIPKSHLDRLEWMYDVGRLEQQQKSAEEYLLGKPVTQGEAESIQDKDKKKGQQQFQTIFKEETTNAKCENFVKVHEDPLFKIMQGENQLKQQLLQNPLKVRQVLETEPKIKIKKEKEKEKEKEKKEKKEKKDKKDKKSKKDKKKKHKRSRSRSQSTDNEKSATSNNSSTQIYQQYLQQRFGNICVKDSNGNLKPDFSMMKKKPSRASGDLNQQRDQMKQFAEDRVKQLQQEEPEQVKGNKQFLNEVRQNVYTNEANKYDRIQRNRINHQKIKD